MNSDTFTALVAISSSLLGVVVGGISQYYITKGQDERRTKQQEKEKAQLAAKRKMTAYRRLNGFADRIMWRHHEPLEGPQKQVSKDELEGIDATIAQNYDVLDESTIKAWDKKFMVKVVYTPELWVWFSFDEFLNDVKKHFDELSKAARPNVT